MSTATRTRTEIRKRSGGRLVSNADVRLLHFDADNYIRLKSKQAGWGISAARQAIGGFTKEVTAHST
jgi:hypothetical protein